jgi:hypothetical protein
VIADGSAANIAGETAITAKEININVFILCSPVKSGGGPWIPGTGPFVRIQLFCFICRRCFCFFSDDDSGLFCDLTF